MSQFLTQAGDNFPRLQRMADALRETIGRFDLVGEFRASCAELGAKHQFTCRPTTVPHWPSARQEFIPPLPGAVRQREIAEIFDFDPELAQADPAQHTWTTTQPQPRQVAIAKGVTNRPFHGRLHLQLVDDVGKVVSPQVCWVAIGVRNEAGPHFNRRKSNPQTIDAPRGLLMRLMWNGKDPVRISSVRATRSA